MILDEGTDKKGKFFKAGLIQRYTLTLENYAGAEWGNRFYSAEFLAGFCARRNEIHNQVAKSSASLLMATTLLAFFDGVTGSINVWGMNISVPEFASLALCVLVSINLFAVLGFLLNQLVIDRLLSILGERIGAYSFELVLMDQTAQNLWISALTQKYHGLMSSQLHKFLFFIVIYSTCYLA